MTSWRKVCRCFGKSKKSASSTNYHKLNADGFISRYIDSKIFMPAATNLAKNIILTPACFGLPHEIVVIETKDGVHLMAFLILQVDHGYSSLSTMIMYHGNGGNIGDCLPIADKFYRGCDCNILMVEYRGFGLSEGFPSEQGLYLDAQASVDYVLSRPDLDSDKIILYGLSIGGAIAIDLASREGYRDQIAGVVVENTFCSLDDLARHLTPGFCKPLIKVLELNRKFQNDKKVSQIHKPILFISGLKDHFIPPGHSVKLYQDCGATHKKILRIPEGGHLNTWNLGNHTEGVRKFICHATGEEPQTYVDFLKDLQRERELRESLKLPVLKTSKIFRQ